MKKNQGNGNQGIAAGTIITLVNEEGRTNQKLRQPIENVQSEIIRVVDENTGYFTVGNIKEVEELSKQKIYRIELVDGKILDCTLNQRLFARTGWTTINEIAEGEKITKKKVFVPQKNILLMCNGQYVSMDEASDLSESNDWGKTLLVDNCKNKEWLESQIEAGKTYREIGEMIGCKKDKIFYWVKKLGIESRSKGIGGQFKEGNIPWNANPDALYRNPEWMQEQVNLGLTCEEIGEKIGARTNLVRIWLHRMGITPNSAIEKMMAQDKTPPPLSLPKTGRKLCYRPVQLQSISYIGESIVYGLKISARWNNFVANGFIVGT